MKKKHKLDVHFSSKKSDWETPPQLFNKLNAWFKFDLDVCASSQNTKCGRFYGQHRDHFTDGLKTSWGKSVCWMNPPYNRPEHVCKPKCAKKMCLERGHHNKVYKPGQEEWIEKAFKESKKGCIVVALLPARTDTSFFHKYIYKKKRVKIQFLEGRLKFVGAKSKAPFPSMIVVFRPRKK